MKALLLAPMGSVHRRFNGVNIEALQSLGYEVHLAANFECGEGTEKQNPDYVKECQQLGIVTHSIPFCRHELLKNLPYVKSVRKLIRDEHFDIVHTHTETGGLILRLVGKTGAKYLYTPHGMSFYKGAPIKAQLVYRPIEHWICSGMDNNIAINLEEYQILKKWNSKTASFIHGIGLNIDRFLQVNKSRQEIRSELGIPEDAAVVLSIGELDDNKNHCVVLEALRDTSAYYLICGVGPNKDKLLQLANEYGMENRVVLAGYRKDIPDIIHSCDVFAFPSIHEGLPVSLMEAMAGGLPAVCSRIRGNVDLIEDGVSGYLVPFSNVLAWKKHLILLLEDDEKRKKFISESLRIIRSYTNEYIFLELKDIYK